MRISTAAVGLTVHSKGGEIWEGVRIADEGSGRLLRLERMKTSFV